MSAARESAAQPAQARQEETGETFDQLVRDVIRPTMGEVGAELERRGHAYEIVIFPGRQITLYLYPSLLRRSAYGASCCPYVSCSRDASMPKIHIVQSTLMPNGHGCADITDTLSEGQVTRHYVAAQILNVLEKVLGASEG